METPFEKLGARCTDFIRALRAAWKPNPTEYNGRFYTIPRGSTSPKPAQQDEHGNPAVPILGGFLSESGLSRVAELCDAWHPAGHTVEMAVTRMQQINQMAKEQFNRGPLKLVHRVFAAPALPSIEKIGDQVMQPSWTGTPDEMLPHLKECKEAGIDEVVIDTSFFKEMTSEDDWIAHPDFFKPLLDEAHR
jgi:alkanesulfonate monooxygenase SsuD/methylene tetrahydromethanopterin reductase-like flavin-dependent oxidoreductase (luciferase family)